MKTVLISSAGRRVALIDCFRRAAAELDIELRVLATDLDAEQSAACHTADKRFSVPRCDSPDFLPAMSEICRSESVDLVIPTIDTELLTLSENTSAFRSLGTAIHVSSPDAVEIVRDKFRTMEVLGSAGLPVPRTADFNDFRSHPKSWEWPLFLKPKSGSASRGLQILTTPKDIPANMAEPMIVQEFLDGPEFTVNMFIDSSGVMRCAVPHERLQIRAGEVEKGITRRHVGIEELAGNIAEAVSGLRGVICFQVIMDKICGPQIIEINARFGGGYPLVDQAGAKFCKWLLEDLEGLPSSANNDWSENTLMLRYDQAVFSERE